MSDLPLARKRCVPCEGGVPSLTDQQIQELLPHVEGWEVKPVHRDGKDFKSIQKSFRFRDFRAAMTFLREVEETAEGEGHHPDFCVHYNVVDFTIWTHAIGGLHENDFILASKIDELQQRFK